MLVHNIKLDIHTVVSVLLNDVKPYQKAVATGPGGTGDYSTWHYEITPKYALIKHANNTLGWKEPENCKIITISVKTFFLN